LINRAKYILIIIAILFALSLPLTEVIAQEEECVNVSAGRTMGVGVWLIRNEMGLSVRYWTTDIDGTEVDFLAPARGGRLDFLIKGLRKVIDTCFIDGYMALGLEIPIGDSLDWQRLDMSVGAEWSFPPLPQIAISLEVGLSVRHYHWYSNWYWKSETFTAMGFHYYF